MKKSGAHLTNVSVFNFNLWSVCVYVCIEYSFCLLACSQCSNIVSLATLKMYVCTTGHSMHLCMYCI